MSSESQSFSIVEQSKISLTGSTFTSNLSIPSEVSNPIIQPTLPFVGAIHGGLKPDTAVLVQGAVPNNSKQFEINFQIGQSYGDGIAFHFNPRITLKYVYMNTLRNGKWEKDETVYDKIIPKETSFSLLILAKSEGYEVYVNGLWYYLFKHRMPLEQVSALGIRGDASISICGFINNWSKTSLCMEQSKIKGLGRSFLKMLPIPSELENPVIQPKIPYIGPISGGIKPGMALFIQGTINPSGYQVSVDFKLGEKKTDAIPFTFNPRIGQYVYMNTFLNGIWGKEQLVVDKPFTKGGTFCILIVVRSDCFQVLVNGWGHCTYTHRMYLGKITTLSIWGDVCIHYFGFAYNWCRSPFFKDQLKITDKGTSVKSPLVIPSEITKAVIQPKIPYSGPISGQLRPGMALYVRGTVLKDDCQFGIAFGARKNTYDDDSDVPFIFNPRFDQYIYQNNYRNNVWNKEELVYDKPFVKGENFTVVIVIIKEGFEVYVNGTRHSLFRHRDALQAIERIGIWGGVSVVFFGFLEDWTASSYFKELSKTIPVGSSPLSIFSIPSEISNLLIQPQLPYRGPINVDIKPGMAFYAEGSVLANANDFLINFLVGPSKTDDVLITFNPRIGQYLYLNTYRNGVWEKEQLAAYQPFMKGTAFNVLIVVTPQYYKMYVNGQKHSTYAHRIPFERIKTLVIMGDVKINFCGFTNNWRRSYALKRQPKLTDVGNTFTSLLPVPSEALHAVIQPTIPYVNTIQGGLKPKMAVLFHGVLPAHAQSFEINFKTGQYIDDSYNDIAFQFNPRMGQYVYMNSYIAKSWGKEECVSDKPFIKGAAFQLFIIITTDGFEVFINGMRHCIYMHRFPLEKITTLDICGDVSILVFSFIDDWSTLNLSQSNNRVMGSLDSRPSSLPLAVTGPFIQPTLPYVSKVAGGLRQNMALFFQGIIPLNSKGFEINLKTGESETDDIAFHFNPHSGQYVSLNSFINGSWDKGESVSYSPFNKGAGFYLFIAINSDNYQVFVNGLEHSTFKHCIPLEKVSTLDIRGDVSKLIYGIIDNWSSTCLCLDQSRITGMGNTFSSLLNTPADLSYVVIQPTLPHLCAIPGGLTTDMAVYFQGTVPAHAVIFEINFHTGWYAESDLSFHFSPRIGNFVYLNSYRNGKWENSESAPIKPFTKETSFNMFIVIKSEGYEVYVNGLFYCLFKHRQPLENNCAISIYGDVSIPIYGFIDNWSKSSFIADQSKITTKGTQSLVTLPAEVSQPIIQPALPYVGKITEGLKPDMAVFFQGTIPTHAKSFEINFKTGPSDGDDIAFHFNPRLGEFVNLNSFRNGSWEKREPTPEIPFLRGTALNMFVVITSEGYEVFVNGLIYCVFKHRIPLEKVSILAIRGDVILPICGITGNWKTCSFCTKETASSTPVPKDVSYLISNPTLPYITEFPGKIKQDMIILFQGTVPADAKSFEINLKTGPSDGDDIALNFNPRIGQYVYLNTFRDGTWEKQETAPDKPFSKGANFQILLVIKSEGYEVYVNGIILCMYKHRIPFQKVLTLAIGGDVSLSTCGFIDNWKTSSFYPLIVTSSPTPIPKDVTFPISNPTLPFVGKIQEEIQQDAALLFQGTVPADAKSFEINFKTGPSDKDDIAFQFNPYFGQYIYLNCFRNGKWEKEETAPDTPFTKGAAFQIIVVFKYEGYEVYVNGVKCCLFNHRIPLEKVSTLDFRGNVSMSMCNLISNWKTSSFYPLIVTSSPTPIPKDVTFPISNPTLPFVGKIQEGIQQDAALLFQGTVPADAKSFEINFKTGPSDKDDIAFQFNPRFGQYIYLNCFRNGKWEKEETAPDTPFTKGAAFQIIVVFKYEGYEVYVNGVKCCLFNHRIPPEKVSTLDFRGNVSMSMCNLISNWKTSSLFSGMGATSTTTIPLEVAYAVKSPTLPYMGNFQGNVKQDMAVLFQGTVPTDSQRTGRVYP
ncbi:uncharacterized protein LOC113650789 isoform X2 [Tachysurus fulvidraco]|uniref:uncharacterized protein LOC113650789 isoform X2 n=1 Tax=Tachysurus fulvidraco TaxID=1234273 RepID=UPI001FEF2CB8|nr:uncharacterized protein LOC113650789 isoform X2 [Tachysurus fulvidraco]